MAVRMTSTPEHATVTCVQLPGRETELVDGEMNQTLGGRLIPLGRYYMLPAGRFVVEFIADCISEWADPESGT